MQLKLLCQGLPVIHIVGLDNQGFDNYKLCQNGFCFGLCNINSINLNEVQKFYSNPYIPERLFEYVNIKDTNRYRPLSDLRNNL